LERQTEDSLKAHQTLVETCLATLTNSQSPEELTQNWTRIEVYFDTLFTTEESIQTLKNSIMQLAVQGSLTASEGTTAARIKEAIAELELAQKQKGIKPGKRGKSVNDGSLLATLPDRWRRIELQDLALQITDGTHLTPKYTSNGKPFLSAKNVKPFRFLPDEHRFVSEEDFESYRSNRKPEKGDVLLTRVGAGIGEAAVIDNDMEFAIYVSVCLIKPFEKYLTADYLCLWLNSPEGRNLATRKTYGRGASQGNLNLELIRTMPIPVPPLEEQLEIVNFTNTLFRVCDGLSSQIEENSDLEKSLANALTSKIH
jgi:type I restriction enzyme S subunit